MLASEVLVLHDCALRIVWERPLWVLVTKPESSRLYEFRSTRKNAWILHCEERLIFSCDSKAHPVYNQFVNNFAADRPVIAWSALLNETGRQQRRQASVDTVCAINSNDTGSVSLSFATTPG